jgi:glycosyltransferase involved in cell wall biosynthesis
VRRLARHASCVVAQSHDTASNLRTYYTPEIVPEIIPLGIPRPAIPERDRAALGLEEDAFVAVAVGRLVVRKAVDRLIQVFAKAGIPGGRLLIMGDGPEKHRLEAETMRLGIGDAVKFLGFVSDELKYRYLAAADVYASTSLHEGFGLVFLEGAAAGLPVVCYNHGGQTDFLVDGKTGYLVEAGDEATLTQRLLELSSNPALRTQLGHGAREVAEAFMIDRCAAQYEDLFERVSADSKAYRPS